MLTIEGLSVRYNSVHAVKNINLTIPENKIISIIGSNGAGKSSILNAISNVISRNVETYEFYSMDLKMANYSKIVKQGIIHCPENRRVFSDFTVEENLKIAAPEKRGKGFLQQQQLIYDYFPILKQRKMQKAGTLSGGEQQMLAIGRAMMAKPKLLLLDEPSLGLAPIIIENIFSIIKRLKEEGTSVLLVEQNAYKALSISDYTYVLENGQILKFAPSEQLIHDPFVKEVYLGIS